MTSTALTTELNKLKKTQEEFSPFPVAPVESIKPKRLPHVSSPFGPGIRSGDSILTIDNGTENDALVLVLKLNGNIKSVMRNSYIHHGKKWTASKIPTGNYVLCVAFGLDWNLEIGEFNIEKGFTKTNNFDVTEQTWPEDIKDRIGQRTRSSKISITLYPVPSGNFPFHKINKQEFKGTLLTP